MQAGHGGFPNGKERTGLGDMMRKRKGEIPAAQRANALLLPGDGYSIAETARVLAWIPTRSAPGFGRFG